ncbi:Prophenoloxidase [Frankliniella occidentalis]|nr:Prophenoloxidase [Frankliniella occidentalis]
MRNLEDFWSCAAYARNHFNPFLFNYAYSVALLHREDTREAHLPPLSESFPDKYVDGSVFAEAREEANTVIDPQQRVPIVIPKDYSASDLEEEHKVAYWREDIGLNLHHWHWHLVYPFEGPTEIVNKDRRGELFFYAHQQIIARYNFERFCNGLQRVKRLLNFREPIVEGYFPKLDSLVSSRNWPARPSNIQLSDLNRETEGMKIDIQSLERWRDRIYEAIHSGVIITLGGQRMNLTEFEGVNTLGALIEATSTSPNRPFYGDLHNMGHLVIAFAHDPDNRHLENFAIMGDTAINMRDPVFYRWHSFVDDMFHEHKRTLQPYTVQQLDFPGIQIKGAEVNSDGARRPNEFHTYWQQNDMDLSRGLDFSPRGPIFARFTHLNHRPFSYRIQVENTAAGQREGYVRIFMAPKNDERGVPLQFRDQRLLMIELDKFPVKPKGEAQQQILRNLDQNRPQAGTAEEERFNFCGCGWPQNLLIPKGTAQGMEVQLFIMITDYTKDKVDQPPAGQCGKATAYCGLRGQRYPDKKPMGFPFDRLGRQGVNNLPSFLTKNMFVKDMTIRFVDRVEGPGGRNVTTFQASG